MSDILNSAEPLSERVVEERAGSLTRKTLIGAAWLVAFRVFTRSIGFVSTLALARLLIPADFGLVAMATTFSAGVEALTQLGLQDALVRRRQEGMELHDTGFTLQAGRALASGGVIALGSPLVANWFHEPRLIPVLLVLAATTAISGFENVGITEFRRAMRFDVQFRLMALPRLISFAATIGVAVVWRSYWALLTGMAVSVIVRTVMTYRVHPYRPRIRIGRWRDLAGFSLWTWATAIANLAWDRCDPFVLGPSFGPAKLGLYLIALEVALLPVSEVVLPAATVLFNTFANVQKDGSSSTHLAPEMGSLLLIALMPMILTISAASGPIVDVLLGAKWVAAWPVVSILVWSCIFSPYSAICATALMANGQVRRNFIANAVISAVKLVALLVAVSFTGSLMLIGAVTACCVAVESLTFLFLLRGTGPVPIRATLACVGRVMVAAAVALGVLAWSGLAWRAAPATTVADLATGAAIGAIATALYVVVLWLLWLVAGRPSGAERRLLDLALGLVGRVRARGAALLASRRAA